MIVDNAANLEIEGVVLILGIMGFLLTVILQLPILLKFSVASIWALAGLVLLFSIILSLPLIWFWLMVSLCTLILIIILILWVFWNKDRVN